MEQFLAIGMTFGYGRHDTRAWAMSDPIGYSVPVFSSEPCNIATEMCDWHLHQCLRSGYQKVMKDLDDFRISLGHGGNYFHPTIHWLSDDKTNYMWYQQFVLELIHEYAHRADISLRDARREFPTLVDCPDWIPSRRTVPSVPPVCIPPEYRACQLDVAKDGTKRWTLAILSWQEFYVQEYGTETWTKRPVPGWLRYMQKQIYLQSI